MAQLLRYDLLVAMRFDRKINTLLFTPMIEIIELEKKKNHISNNVFRVMLLLEINYYYIQM